MPLHRLTYPDVRSVFPGRTYSIGLPATMQFRKSLLCSNISLILSAGLLLSQTASAQEQTQSGQSAARTTSQWSCFADANGNWQCVENPAAARATPRGVVTRTDSNRGSIANNAASPATSAAAAQWVSSAEMTPEQRAALPNNCCGGFVEPQ